PSRFRSTRRPPISGVVRDPGPETALRHEALALLRTRGRAYYRHVDMGMVRRIGGGALAMVTLVSAGLLSVFPPTAHTSAAVGWGPRRPRPPRARRVSRQGARAYRPAHRAGQPPRVRRDGRRGGRARRALRPPAQRRRLRPRRVQGDQRRARSPRRRRLPAPG